MDIAALLEPFLDHPLSSVQLDQTSMYIDLLLRWNARINLTAVRNPEEIVTRHFGESFFLARQLFPELVLSSPAPRVLDLGSGAGFPGVPTKIWAPHIDLTLIESNYKKAAFLREVIRTITLTNVDVIADRAEAVAAGIVAAQPAVPSQSKTAGASRIHPPGATGSRPLAQPDVVTFRAVEKFDQMLKVASRFLAPQTRFALLITSAQTPRLQSINPMKWRTIYIPGSQQRLVAIGERHPQAGI
jgi:16S rRNA G527 N7-methylase RsmG